MLNFQVLVALVAVGSDGELDAAEAEAILRIAAENSLDALELQAPDDPITGSVSVDLGDFSALAESDREFIYVAAAWITRLDGRVAEAEVDVLNRLVGALWLSPEVCIHVDGISRDIADCRLESVLSATSFLF